MDSNESDMNTENTNGTEKHNVMDNDLTHIRIAIGLHAVVAIAMGWVSILVSGLYGDTPSILAGLVVLWVIGKATNKMTGKKDFKWWFGNGVIIYLFVWLISWIVFYNMALAGMM